MCEFEKQKENSWQGKAPEVTRVRHASTEELQNELESILWYLISSLKRFRNIKIKTRKHANEFSWISCALTSLASSYREKSFSSTYILTRRWLNAAIQRANISWFSTALWDQCSWEKTHMCIVEWYDDDATSELNNHSRKACKKEREELSIFVQVSSWDDRRDRRECVIVNYCSIKCAFLYFLAHCIAVVLLCTEWTVSQQWLNLLQLVKFSMVDDYTTILIDDTGCQRLIVLLLFSLWITTIVYMRKTIFSRRRERDNYKYNSENNTCENRESELWGKINKNNLIERKIKCNRCTSMEIYAGSMDNMSQQYYGMGSDQPMANDEFAYEQFADQPNYDYAQQQSEENYPESSCDAATIVCDNNSVNWLNENSVKCKREIDLADITQSSSANFDRVDCDYAAANCSRMQYDTYDPSMKYMNDANSNLISAPFVKPMLPSTHRPSHRSYHISSMNSHNQIPNWYTSANFYEQPPPQSPFHSAYSPHFRENYLPPQHHHHPHADVNMRNMMSMSNRYLFLCWKCELGALHFFLVVFSGTL